MRRMLLMLALIAAPPAWGLQEHQVLLLWNSANAESAAVRTAYLAARPGVLEFDFANADLGPGELNRAQYNARVRVPLAAHLSQAVGGVSLAEQVIAIATTRGLPARIGGPGEFTLASERASLESELSLMFQDLDGTGASSLPFRRSGIVDNPYHFSAEPIDTFPRGGILTVRPFSFTGAGNGEGVWTSTSLTPGDVFLVCRLDAAPGAETTALEETLALIARSSDPAQMRVVFPCVQALFDEYPDAADQLDDDALPPAFPGAPDFENAASFLAGRGVLTLHDESIAFITGASLDPSLPLLVLGTYGENHDLNGAGADPPGNGTYLTTYAPHPAGVAVSYESFSGQGLVNGAQRQNQANATDWIARGGSFIIPTVAEPFSFAVADLDAFVRNFYGAGLTFAEAAYTAMPGLSWANVPVGDPLARVTVGPAGTGADLSGDGEVGPTDLAILLAGWGTSGADLDGDGSAGAGDLAILLAAWGPVAACSPTAP